MDRTPSQNAPLPPAVNFHLWEPCNMRCRFCFATFQDVRQTVLPKGHLPEEDALRVVDLLTAAGFDKLTFVGGEPTLCPWLGRLIDRARAEGCTTMLVTNGSRLAGGAWLDRHGRSLDWVALSVDSARPETHEALGRSVHGRAIAPADYLHIAREVHRRGLRLKVNTVVSAANWAEDMSDLILAMRPERWKLLRVLPVAGQNDGRVEPLLIGGGQLAAFHERHRRVEAAGVRLVCEDHEDIIGGYAMVDPAGRFFDNATGRHVYSAPILDVGVAAAWAQVRFSEDRFAARGGYYDWGTQVVPAARIVRR